jgi:hypothetical protein
MLLLFLSGHAAAVDDACRWESPNGVTYVATQPAMESDNRDTYTGAIRVYVTEIEGRWDDSDGKPFHNAFLGFALEDDISLGDNDTLTWEVLWDGNDYFDGDGFSYGDLQEDNVKVIAAVFNSASYTGYSDPPANAPFAVHEVDACAGATPGRTGYNLTASGFTHTVFVEDGATTW